MVQKHTNTETHSGLQGLTYQRQMQVHSCQKKHFMSDGGLEPDSVSKTGVGCSRLAPKEPESRYFCSLLATQTERGRLRTEAKFHPLQTLTITVEWKSSNARTRPESGQGGEDQVEAENGGQWREEEEKTDLYSKTQRIIDTEKNSQQTKIER